MKAWRYRATAMACLFAAGCAASAQRSAQTEAPVAVAIEAATVTTVSDTFEAGGVVRARLTANVASRVMAAVAAVNCRPGDRVARGTVLVTLDGREAAANALAAVSALAAAVETARAADAEVHEAESGLQLAQATHDRVKTLFDKGSATPHEFDEAVGARGSAEARVAAARARAAAAQNARLSAESASRAAETVQSYTAIVAPFDGIVSERLSDPGSMAVPGTPLLVLEDPSDLRLEVPIDQSRAGNVRVGQTIDLRIDGLPDAEWRPGRIVEISRIDPASHDFVVKISIADRDFIRTGMFGRARFSGTPRSALTVPAASLIRRGQLTFVLGVDGGIARLRAVVEGVTVGGHVEVLAGLKAGDVVIVSPPAVLTDGTPVNGRRP